MVRPALSKPWVVLALLFVARASMALQFQSVPPVAPYLVEAWAIGYAEIGVLIGLFMAPGVLLALPGGMLSARFGDKALALAGLALLCAGPLLLVGGEGFAPAVVGRLLGGVGAVLLNVVATKMVTDWFAGGRLATAMGILVTSWPAGIALALAGLSVLAEAVSWRSALLVPALVAAVTLVLVALLVPPRPPAAGMPAGPARPDAAGSAWHIGRTDLALALLAGAVWTLMNAGQILFLSYTPSLLSSLGSSVAAAGLLVSVVSWCGIVSMPLGGWLADRSGRPDDFIVGGVLACALIMWLMPLGGHPVVSAAAFGLLLGATPGPIMSLPGKALSPAGRATGFGLFFTVYYTGMAAFPPLAGWLRDVTAAPAAPLYLGGLLMWGAMPALFAFRALQARGHGIPAAAGATAD